jgi:murein DD-endopeptidase MepM/ murein hydrolase activator NlpD
LPDRQVTPSAADLERIRNEAEQMTAARERAYENDELYLDGDFIWPVTGRITGVFGSQRILNGEPRRPHNGVDIAANTGTPIVAPAAGVVVFVHPDMYFNGATVILDHGHGLTSVYCHMHRIKVEPGQTIEQGQPIGEVGASGRATGPHLHWGVELLQNRIDPKLLVGAMPD